VQDDAAVGEHDAVAAAGLHRAAGELVRVQRRVQAAPVEQLGVRAGLDDPTAVEDEDRVGGEDRR
jgi:hypothetical protein